MSATPQLSVVVPVHNEEDNVAPLVGEIVAALRGLVDFEIVYVDDTSRDSTLERLRALQVTTPELRVIRHLTNAGQSTAVRNGVKAARAPKDVYSSEDLSRIALFEKHFRSNAGSFGYESADINDIRISLDTLTQ